MIAPTTIIQDSPPDTSYGFRKCCEAIRNAVPIEEVARRYTDLEPFGGEGMVHRSLSSARSRGQDA